MNNNAGEALKFRPLNNEDVPFMEQIAYLASYSINGSMLPIAPPFDEYRQTIGLKYTADWGRTGDYGIIAINDGNDKIGAAWYRTYTDSELPNRLIEIAVLPPYQTRKGVGTTLLQRLILDAQKQDINHLHLTVDDENLRAISLYRKLGFVTTGKHFNLDIMRLTLY